MIIVSADPCYGGIGDEVWLRLVIEFNALTSFHFSLVQYVFVSVYVRYELFYLFERIYRSNSIDAASYSGAIVIRWEIDVQR